jgi:hypothetical protein
MQNIHSALAEVPFHLSVDGRLFGSCEEDAAKKADALI